MIDEKCMWLTGAPAYCIPLRFTPRPDALLTTETIVKTVVELLSILGLATKLVKQRQPCEYLLAGILFDSMQRRDICKQALWGEL